MKERWAVVSRFLQEAWWDLFRWMLAFCLISMGIATVILWWKFQTYPFLVYFGCFWGSLFAAWLLMWRRKPVRREFRGDA